MQKQQDKIAGKIERLYKGEIAYLKEVKQLRESRERKQKLLQGKQHLQKRQIIPQAFTTDAAASFAQFDENMRQIEKLQHKGISDGEYDSESS